MFLHVRLCLLINNAIFGIPRRVIFWYHPSPDTDIGVISTHQVRVLQSQLCDTPCGVGAPADTVIRVPAVQPFLGNVK